MVIWVILNTNRNAVMAITEDQAEGEKYIEVKRLGDECSFFYVKGDRAEKLALDYEDLYLEYDPVLNLVMTRAERNLVAEIISSRRDEIETMLAILPSLAKGLSWRPKETKLILKLHKLLMEKSEPKEFRKLLDLKKFVRSLGRGKTDADLYQKKVEETTSNKWIWFH